MAAFTYGKAPFGFSQILPLAEFPSGKKRIKCRHDDFVKVFVKTDDGIEGWYPQEMNGVWIPYVKFSANKTI